MIRFLLLCCLVLSACSLASSEARRLAESIRESARQLRQSGATDATVVYDYSQPGTPYSLVIHPCMDSERLTEHNDDLCGGLTVRANGRQATSTRHLTAVLIPARLNCVKEHGGPARIRLHRKGDRVLVVSAQ